MHRNTGSFSASDAISVPRPPVKAMSMSAPASTISWFLGKYVVATRTAENAGI